MKFMDGEIVCSGTVFYRAEPFLAPVHYDRAAPKILCSVNRVPQGRSQDFSMKEKGGGGGHTGLSEYSRLFGCKKA